VLFDEPTPPRRIDSTIPRSLETVELKAMAKEPSGRYATARELADDLRRFLADSPVLARPRSSLDRAAGWVRRHRTAVASVLLWRERDRTASALDETRRALDRESRAMDMIVMAAHAVTMRAMAVVTIRGERDNNPTDRPFLEEALAFYQSVERMTRDDPHRREATAKAWFGIGLTRWLLGQTDAEEAFRRSIASYDLLLADAPSEDRRVQRLASLKYLGLVVHQARGLAQSEPIFRSLLAEERGLVASGRSGRVPTIYLANDLRIWGQMLEEAGRREDAEKAIREANEMAPSQER
jgi:eukaryotic-like serine/threonine-protein kinase